MVDFNTALETQQPSTKDPWLKTPSAILIRCVPSSVYFSRICVRGKLICHCSLMPASHFIADVPKSGLLHFMFPGARQYAWVVLCSSPGWRLMRGYVPKMRCVLYAFPKGMTAGFAVSDGLWQINQIPTMPW